MSLGCLLNHVVSALPPVILINVVLVQVRSQRGSPGVAPYVFRILGISEKIVSGDPYKTLKVSRKTARAPFDEIVWLRPCNMFNGMNIPSIAVRVLLRFALFKSQGVNVLDLAMQNLKESNLRLLFQLSTIHYRRPSESATHSVRFHRPARRRLPPPLDKSGQNGERS